MLLIVLDSLNLFTEEPVYSSEWYQNVALRYNDDEFQQFFRIPKSAFEEVINEIRPFYTMRLDLKAACLSTIWMLASGSNYRTIAALFGIPLTTYCRVVHHICICQAFSSTVHSDKSEGFKHLFRLLQSTTSKVWTSLRYSKCLLCY